MKKYPQIFLSGNGLNRAYDSVSWDEAIKKVWNNKRVSVEYDD